MNLASRTVAAVRTRLVALTTMVFTRYPRTRFLFGRLPEEPNYAATIGDGRGSNLLMSCISWIVNGFTQMRPIILELDDEDLVANRIARHPALRVFRRPGFHPDLGYSPFTWLTLMAGLLISFIVDGNAYAFKIRGAGGAGKPVQLWYVPHWMLTPMPDPDDPSVFVAYYDYCPDGVRHYPVRVQDVIHLRDGTDPDNTRKGLSKVKTLLRELMTDEHAAAWTMQLLINHAVPGVVISPEQSLSDESDGAEVEAEVMRKWGAGMRGRPMVMLDPTKVQQYGFNPEQMKLADIRNVPEERVSMATGVQAAVVGAGTGLESTKVGATMAELVDLSWQNGTLPRARIIAADLTEQYLSEWEVNAGDTVEFSFDTSQVAIMADYRKKMAETQEILFRSGIATRGMSARALGLKRGQRDDVYMLQAGAIEVDATKTLEQTQAVADEKAKELAAVKTPLALPPGPTKEEEAEDERKSLDLQREERRADRSAFLEGIARLQAGQKTPEVKVEIHEGAIQVKNEIAPAAAPSVTVEAPEIKVEPPVIPPQLELAGKTTKVTARDAGGRIAETVETYKYKNGNGKEKGK